VPAVSWARSAARRLLEPPSVGGDKRLTARQTERWREARRSGAQRCDRTRHGV